MSLSIEMTLRGVLAAGKWRNEASLKTMSDEDCRNTLIVELAGHTKRAPEDNPQRFNNDELIGKGAIVVFLAQAMRYNRDKLKTMSDDEQRNAIIAHNNTRTGIPMDDLKGLTNQQLVRLALVE
ncbi:hypothetical protein [Methylobacterium nodulans]|uniref:Uncharacterized protein n=1 Tax=Methylobacterium nodulans (strain LMG 21967 / CNCM I-2342 / ORS 2060) TaxID=460265 RepID=B8INQ9_METNO|nr:hypothetical protein [Methylobacterium nodulans]ACL58425.1 hypothetical protein Mnod_3515 [Methylobacterium nodulans ORS 2060]